MDTTKLCQRQTFWISWDQSQLQAGSLMVMSPVKGERFKRVEQGRSTTEPQ